ncbi:MAG: phage portal protein, partial [Myxococcota bacterium]|nr:phage portal protein [Myxococcota bacterium]
MGLLARIAPRWSLLREQARRRLEILNSGYSRHGASRTKKSLLGWLTEGGSPDQDVTENLVTLRERSRDLYMGTPLATGALKTLRTNIVGQGLRLNAQVDAASLGLTQDEAD